MIDNFQRYKQIRAAIFFLRSVYTTVSINAVNSQFKAALGERGIRRDVIARCIHIEREEQYRRDHNMLRGELTLEAFDAIRDHLGTLRDQSRPKETDSTHAGNASRPIETERDSLNDKQESNNESNPSVTSVTSGGANASPSTVAGHRLPPAPAKNGAPAQPQAGSVEQALPGMPTSVPAALPIAPETNPKPKRQRDKWAPSPAPDLPRNIPTDQHALDEIVRMCLAAFGNLRDEAKVAANAPFCAEILSEMREKSWSLQDAWDAFGKARLSNDREMPLHGQALRKAFKFGPTKLDQAPYQKPAVARPRIHYHTAASVAAMK